ncbi:hypothetical protein GPJ81_10085 [Pseudomonas alkylphenolica]|uniref:Uncharacterized protein n=1 Tax=Pseudomonas alkylphenolica TaxID=237609 RepID=A0A6I6GRF8_9PSED|nr:hypothetical protein [Pseudomonas alkylphenolica]QGW77010.1 hypothetical protein GPJ81_10085 [Pseudomonas alkylphenolica]
MDVVQYYRELIQNSNTVLGAMIEANGTEALTASHNYLLDYDALKMAIADRPEAAVFDSAVKEYQFALFALASGQYRHAFGGLRLFFELMLATVQFSAHEIDYRMWAKDSKDINWSALKDSQTGVFATNFIRAFNPDFSDCGKQYLAIAEAVYRECSEFVHGNAGTHAILPTDITFQNDVFCSWHNKATTMRLAIIFAFSARYLNYVDRDATERMEPIITDVIGDLPPVRAIFAQPSGAQ